MDNEASHQPKHERSRTRWTSCLDKVFADLVVKQIQLGNRQNNVFDKKAWNNIRDEFNRQTDLTFNNNQLRKHLDVLRQRYNTLRSSHPQNEFVVEDACCIGFDLWEDLGVQQRPETMRVKDCPIYEQLCTIFADDSTDGKYAQSSHFQGLEESITSQTPRFTTSPDDGIVNPENPSTSKLGQGNTPLSERDSRSFKEGKRKRQSEMNINSVQSQMDPETIKTMAEALFDMAASVRSRMAEGTNADDRFSITNCIRALDEIENVDESIYFAALDLFENPSFRETFLSLKGDKIRLTWLQGKCRKFSPFVV